MSKKRSLYIEPKLSILIVTYNSEKWIGKCLKSLNEEIKQRGKIIIIDNHSTDLTLNEIKKTSKKLRIVPKVIQNSTNSGFANGINIGLRETNSKYILLLNPDTEIVPGAIKILLKHTKKNKAHIVGGKAHRVDGSIHGSFVKKPTLSTLLFVFTNLRKLIPGDIFYKTHYYLDEKFPDIDKKVDAVSGAYMLIDRDVFKSVGLFDNNYFMYLEDVDLCVRAKDKGMKIMFCPHSVINHTGGASSKNKDRIHYHAWSKSRRYYAWKHFSFVENVFIQPAFYLDDLVSNIWRRVR